MKTVNFSKKRKDELFPIADRQKRVKDKTKSEIKAVLGQFSSKFRVKNQAVDQLIKTIDRDWETLIFPFFGKIYCFHF